MKDSENRDGGEVGENKYVTVDFWRFVLGFSLIILGTLALILLLRYASGPDEAGSVDLISTTSVPTTSQPAQASSTPR